MSGKFWDWCAPVYAWAMRPERSSYQWMCQRIHELAQDKRVLELACGPGLIALDVADATRYMVATDLSEGMVAEAQRRPHPEKLRFELADATDLPYEDASFDVVIIANALHVMPAPEKALAEIGRVLAARGVLVAPNYVMRQDSGRSRPWATLLGLLGVRFEHSWDSADYLAFLRENGWVPQLQKTFSVRIPQLYVECVHDAALRRTHVS